MGLADLWPNRVTALSKSAALRPAEMVAAAGRLLKPSVGGADVRQNRLPLERDEPVRFLPRDF